MIGSKVVFLSFALLVACFLPACSRLIPYAGGAMSTSPASVRTPVYVADFEFGPEAFRRESGMLPVDPIAPASGGGVVARAFGVPEDPSCRAQELADLMSSALTEDLAKAGLDARRLRAGEPPPTQGWLVRGTFTDMNEGNRLGRALIGLGAGRTHFQVFVFVDRLAAGASQSPYALNTSDASSAAPGAVFLLSPIAAVARFMSGAIDLDASVTKTASKIARQITQRIDGC